jgi:alkylhydroperoxidase/carboxymuconolactone decarboxylase family protein YurZ
MPRRARDRGASRAEVAETIGVAIHMGGGPSMVYGAEALRAYDAFAGERGG